MGAFGAEPKETGDKSPWATLSLGRSRTQWGSRSWSRIEPGAVTGAAWCRSLQALARQQTQVGVISEAYVAFLNRRSNVQVIPGAPTKSSSYGIVPLHTEELGAHPVHTEARRTESQDPRALFRRTGEIMRKQPPKTGGCHRCTGKPSKSSPRTLMRLQRRQNRDFGQGVERFRLRKTVESLPNAQQPRFPERRSGAQPRQGVQAPA